MMVCIGGSIGKSAIAPSRMAFNQQINNIRPILYSSKLLNYSMSTRQFQAAILESATGSATPIINRSKWEELLVPIAPKGEQVRIVNKVDQLRALCAKLRKRLTDRSVCQSNLASTLIEQSLLTGSESYERDVIEVA
jgi:type I restriction enzyme, S subunit